jgi:hypothetical protein
MCVYLYQGVSACRISSPVTLDFCFTLVARRLAQQTSNKKDRNNPKDRQGNPSCYFYNVLIIKLLMGFCSGYLRTSLPDTKCALR